MRVKFNKVLLVDDDKINNYLTEEIISDSGITDEVVVLTDGQKALDYLNQLEPNSNEPENILILLDLNMPVMDGFEFLEGFKSIPKMAEFEMVILTSSDNQRDKEKINQYNISKFISKPITEEKLLKVL